MKALLTCIFVAVFAIQSPGAKSASLHPDLVLWYDKPAQRWEQETLPIGNAFMGAMIFGGVGCERIQFNEESLWIGDEEDTGAYQAFGDVMVQLADSAMTKEPEISSPSGHAISGSQGVEASCDGNPATKWCFEHQGVFPIVWQAHVFSDQKEPLNSYTLTSANDVPGRDPTAWRFLGSHDGKQWTLLDERKDVPTWPTRNSPLTFHFANKTAYSWYRFEFLAVHQVSHFQLAEIALGSIPLASTGSQKTAAIGTVSARPDAVVNPEQARQFAAAMQRAGNRCDLVLLDGARHAFVIARYTASEERVVDAIRKTDGFLIALGLLSGEPTLQVGPQPAWPAGPRH
jgi:hypothetical protein